MIASAKSGFIAGADVAEFGEVREPAEPCRRSGQPTPCSQRLERLPCPTVAAINGYCLGGGLELALACRHRVCADDPHVTLGLPEVMLGIHPGFGGTVRSVQLIGVTTAMDMMLTGKNLRPAKALAVGLVDQGRAAGRLRARRRNWRCGRSPGAAHLYASDCLACRWCVASSPSKIEQQVRKRARREHYPAPYAIVDLWRRARRRVRARATRPRRSPSRGSSARRRRATWCGSSSCRSG